MKRLLLLLPLLLVAACQSPEPPKPTTKQVATALLLQILEIQAQLDSLLAEADASGDRCTNAYEMAAGMEMMAPKWRAIAVVKEAQGEVKETMQAKSMADKVIADARKIRLSCR